MSLAYSADLYRDAVPWPDGHYQVPVADHPRLHGGQWGGDRRRPAADGPGMAV